MDYFDPLYFGAYFYASDYFDCDYFDQTYFDTPDCGDASPTGGRRVGPVPLRPIGPDEADEFLAVI